RRLPVSLVKGLRRPVRRGHPPPRPCARRCRPRAHPSTPPPPRTHEPSPNHGVDALDRIPETLSPEESAGNGDDSVENHYVWRNGAVDRRHVWRNDRLLLHNAPVHTQRTPAWRRPVRTSRSASLHTCRSPPWSTTER